MESIKENENINKILQYEDPNMISETLVNEMNSIINKLAPPELSSAKRKLKYTSMKNLKMQKKWLMNI